MKGNDFRGEIEKLAKLSALDVKGDEAKYAGQLSGILEFVGKLNKLDLEEVKETSQVNGLENVMAEDKAGESLEQKEVLTQAVAIHEGMVMVKAVFGEEGDE